MTLAPGPEGKIPLWGFPSRKTSSILNVAMKKRKTTPFTAEKAVKANARERVGQPKPARVIDTEPKQGRRAKYKEKLEELAEQRE